jgi:hypothetical protein
LAGAFLAGAAASLGGFTAPRATSLNPLSAVILATLLAGTLTVAPVWGFRASRAGRLFRSNLAKPDRFTTSPLATVARMTSIVPSTIFWVDLASVSVCAATAPTSSRLFNLVLLEHGVALQHVLPAGEKR